MGIEWIKLGSFSEMKYGKMPKKDKIKVEGEYPIYSGYRVVGYYDEYNLEEPTLIVVARGVGGTGDVKVSPAKCYLTNLSISVVVDEEVALKEYLYYYFQINNLRYLDSGSAQSQITISDLGNVEVPIPTMIIQRKIVDVLKSLDKRIENNNQINRNLSVQAQTIFSEELLKFDSVPEGWKESNLLGIAEYLNGLAMQKYRPEDGEIGLPVLKIKELRQGTCDSSSEGCSPSIKPEYIIKDGDVIFSWSGSLLVDFWCGGPCGLNQHLFKVTSKKYDKWFYYAWTLFHLDRFIAVAADKATTMGHIKRGELEKAEVLIPSEDDYERIGSLLAPIYDMIIANRVENIKLAALRDSLLPKLMSGELDVSELDL